MSLIGTLADDPEQQIENFSAIRNTINGMLTDENIDHLTSLADADHDTLIQIEETADEDKIRFDIAGTEQIVLEDGKLVPTTDNDIDLGDSTHEFKDLYIDGIANIDTLKADALGANIDCANYNMTNVDIDSGVIDGVTIGATAAPTVTDLGSVATCDINGGTLDGVQIGGTTATGELIVNNASDEADGLGSQGTAGQYLQSAGAGANPVFATVETIRGWVRCASDTSVYDSYNVSSVTDNGTGDYTINWDTDFALNNYCPIFKSCDAGSAENMSQIGAIAADALRLLFFSDFAQTTAVDSAFTCGAWGDQ